MTGEPVRVRGRYETVIQAYSDPYAPPDEPVLRVAVIGDRVLLDICQYDEEPQKVTLTELKTIDVPLMDLLRAIWPGSWHTAYLKAAADNEPKVTP